MAEHLQTILHSTSGMPQQKILQKAEALCQAGLQSTLKSSADFLVEASPRSTAAFMLRHACRWDASEIKKDTVSSRRLAQDVAACCLVMHGLTVRMVGL